MSMQSFDIESLLRFTPPKYLCQKCYALLLDEPPSDWETSRATCPVCGVEYLPTKEYKLWEVGAYLESQGLHIQFRDLIGHSRSLARIAYKAREFLALPKIGDNIPPHESYPPMHALFEALQNAEKFVHFTTYGISHMLLGAIKMTAQQVDVRGIVSNVEDNMTEELTKYEDEAPKLDIKLFERKGQMEKRDATPHQKIIVVDGLLAFKGSANLTISGWRKASQGLDVIELVTDVREVVDLNNRFFSPIWARFSDVQRIEMEDLPSFDY